MAIIGEQRPIRAIQRFLETVDREVEDIPYEIKTSVVREIVRTGSIDTARMIQAVDYHGGVVTDGHHYEVDASKDDEVTYDGFVDQPIRPNAFGFTGGRLFNQRGIEGANLGAIFDSWANSSFVI